VDDGRGRQRLRVGEPRVQDAEGARDGDRDRGTERRGQAGASAVTTETRERSQQASWIYVVAFLDATVMQQWLSCF
jgi:hypothetical protein